MASTAVLLLQLLLVSLASASHLLGTSATYTYRGQNPDGTYKVDLHTKSIFKTCDSLTWSCYGSNCRNVARSPSVVIDKNTNTPINTCVTETVFTTNVRSDKPFQMRVPQNCPRTYKLTSFDPDGDKVRCRYGNVKGRECDSCNLPPGFLLDQGSCTLHYNYTRANINAFGLELVVEDFPQSYINLQYADGSKSYRTPTTVGSVAPPTPTAPLSKLPMQFSFLVDPPAPSCQEGAFLPKLLAPTPANGARFLAEVNKELEIRVKAHAINARINNIFISGPANIRKQQTTQGEFVLRWTPLPDDHGQHFVICFAVEAVKPPAVYQSEMRCVLVEARSEIVKSHVICNESSMTVSVEKASFPRLHEDHMQLNDPSNTACSLQRLSNSTHIIATIPLNACGTQIEEDKVNLIFKNEISTVDNPRDLITRKHLMEVQFYCQYPKRGKASLGFVAHRKNITVWEKGFGTFTYQFEFYPNNQFQTRMDPAAYPLEYDIGNRIYMKIKATSLVNNTELFVESCRAAPYDNPSYRPTYSIFENGCQMDPTLQIHSPADQKEFKFSMEAFKFIGLNNQVYISCSVMMCEAGNSNTRCSKGCINSTLTSPRRSKREAVIQSASHFVSQGPLRLRRSAERVGATATNLNLNLVFIAGCVLAAVGMVCGVVMYRAKVSKVKYQPLPTFET
ncbi:zona pellucida sperm-binding protein 2-like [Limanda limanda]|uniref:zona pellucida sperm-binding protein 2-like n=1 Tax=Limanda limanda TaxID=27771 RepID=UPI0029C67B84|nr:zona pellucida sperm-binding protein 2-like [Limanda limanda]